MIFLSLYIEYLKSVLKKSYVLEHLLFRCCSANVKNLYHLIFQELPLNSPRTVEVVQFKNVHEQLYQNNSWKVLNNSRNVLNLFWTWISFSCRIEYLIPSTKSPFLLLNIKYHFFFFIQLFSYVQLLPLVVDLVNFFLIIHVQI
jgi:hypothetical protein